MIDVACKNHKLIRTIYIFIYASVQKHKNEEIQISILL